MGKWFNSRVSRSTRPRPGLAILAALTSCAAPSGNPSLERWAAAKSREIRRIDPRTAPPDARFNVPRLLEPATRSVHPLNEEERRRAEAMRDLYARAIGRDSLRALLWTGIESANPLTRDGGYRWNSLREQGMYDAAKRQKLVAKLNEIGIVNLRVGLTNHEIDADDDRTWAEHDAILGDLAAGGLRLSLDLHHFGIEDRFRAVDADGKTVPERSWYLHPEWPDYFARFAGRAFDRYGDRIRAVTLINEPEPTVGFNSEFWHGAFPGWSSPQHNFYYIERAIQVGKAAVKARMAIEERQAKRETRADVFYLHTEATVYKPYWEDFNRFVRFFVSDLMLGHEWLMEADLDELERQPMDRIVGRWRGKRDDERTAFDWIIENYVVYRQPPEKRDERRARLVALLRELRGLHRELKARYGKTMRDDLVFAVDYYTHNEDKDREGVKLDPRPENYPGQVRSGRRAGLYAVIVDYYNHFRVPVMIGESGTPWHAYGAMWAQQMLLECAKAAGQGVPFLGYTLYPAIDTYGWETALSVPKEKTILNPSGIVDLNLEPRPFIHRLIDELKVRIPER